MNFTRVGLLLVIGSALGVFQFATLSRSNAAQVRKTVDPSPQVPLRGRLPSALISLHAEGDAFARYALLVDKKLRTLMVWDVSGDHVKFVSAFGIDSGAKPGDKLKQGDHRTPEGIYFVQESKNGRGIDSEKYGDRVFTLDYPNTFDRLEKKTGGGIWIHAISDKSSLKRGSRGCIVVRNSSVEFLTKYVEPKRTPVVVMDSVEYLSEAEWEARRAEFKQAFASKSELRGLQVFSLGNKVVAQILESETLMRTVYALKRDTGDWEILKEN